MKKLTKLGRTTLICGQERERENKMKINFVSLVEGGKGSS